MALEAFTALGLAGNVVQFIEFSLKLLSLSSDIRKSSNGSAQVYEDIHAAAEDIWKSTLMAERERWDDRPRALMYRVVSVAKELLDKLDNVKKKRHGGKRWNSFRQALEFVWKEEDIRKFQSRLESLRNEFQYYIVIETR